MSLIGHVKRIRFADRMPEDALPGELRTPDLRWPLVLTDASGEADDTLDRLADVPPAGIVALRHVEAMLAQGGRSQVPALAMLGGADAVIGPGGAEAADLARITGRKALPAVPVIALPTTTANVGLGLLAEGPAAQKGLGGVHALALALAAEAGPALRHGCLHAALLAPVMTFNAPAVADRLPALRAALRLPPGADVIAVLAAPGRRIGLPERLTALHLDTPALVRVAPRAAEGVANGTTPRHATTAGYRHLPDSAL